MKLKKTIFASGISFLLITLGISFSFADDLLDQNDFNNGIILPWNVSESEEANSDFALVNGEYVITINKATPNRWDIQTRHRGITLQQGHTYTVKFKIKSSKATKVYAKIGQIATPFNEYWNNNWNPISLDANVSKSVEQTFTMTQATDATCEFAFHLGGDLVSAAYPLDVALDDIYLSDPQYTKPPKPVPPPKPVVRVNQVGYLPAASKFASVLSTSTAPLDWKLKNGSGTIIATGKTTVFGRDPASGDTLHTIDFSTCKTPGSGYLLVVSVNGTEKSSHPFDIKENVYSVMKYDALAYFYHNRSGIAITMPYCGRADLARLAGHPQDVGTTVEIPSVYTLDVTGGWYDAGDHGKYVVNGGIALWTMLNQYERAVLRGTNAPFADGTMNIPEKGNGIADILDEARWEMSMLLKMQVPADKPLAGMAHHKLHDEKWTALATRPDQDLMKRIIKPPSTAATLNLAATGAMSARIWKTIDTAFANKCLRASELAWTAAVAHPALYASTTDKIGGGPYGDSCVTDDFYWAACELFATTGKETYKTYLQSSPYYLKMPSVLDINGEDKGLTGPFTWGATSGLGTVTLAMVSNTLPASEIAKARNAIRSASDVWLATMNGEGYRLPIPTGSKGYPWGSNSFVLNCALVMALAYDFSGEQKYFDGVAGSMDYLLGRNAMDKCYVSGYGSDPLANPHHRFWAKQADATFPTAPAGVIAGGPNSGLEDPWVRSAGMAGSTPQKCYLDNIEAWSANEITINWNAPLAWVTAFLDEKGGSTGVNGMGDAKGFANNATKTFSIQRNGMRLEIGNSSANPFALSIMDLSGRVIYKEQFNGIKNRLSSIALNRLSKGAYLVKIKAANAMLTKRIILE